jgi:hypothetical protein
VRVLGIILIVLGIAGLVVGGITYTRNRHTVNVGPLSASIQERETIPIPPVLGGVAVLAGVLLLVASRRSRT